MVANESIEMVHIVHKRQTSKSLKVVPLCLMPDMLLLPAGIVVTMHKTVVEEKFDLGSGCIHLLIKAEERE